MTDKIVLGFDISSSTIGYSVIAIDGLKLKLVEYNYIKPQKDGDIIERIANTRDKINDIINRIKPDEIGIEQIVKFMKGSSSANTIIVLTSFNRMVSLLAYDYLGYSPQLFNVLTIRHSLKRAANLKDLPAKEDLPNIIEKLLNFQFDWELNKKGNPREQNYDKCDAACVALHYSYVLTGQHQKSKITKTKKIKKVK